MRKIFAISGDGNGAGKSTAAKKLVGATNIISLASIMRSELREKYPQSDWFNKDQAYKEGTVVPEEGGKTVRQVLIDYGQSACENDPWYWVRALCFTYQDEIGFFAIDDLRKLVEIDFLRGFFGPDNVVHIHIEYAGAKFEPLYDNAKLKARADYVIVRPSDAIPAAHVPNVPEMYFQWHYMSTFGDVYSRGPKYATRAIAEQAKEGLLHEYTLYRETDKAGKYQILEVPK